MVKWAYEKNNIQMPSPEEIERQKDRRAQLEKKHDDEFVQLEDKWNNPEFLKKYAKPSARLLHLKEIYFDFRNNH